MAAAVIAFLEANGIHKQNLLYSGFNGARLKQFLAKGFDPNKDENRFSSPAVYCTTEQALHSEYDEHYTRQENALIHAVEDADHDIPALAIYDGNLLRRTNDLREHAFEPVQGITYKDALVAVIKLKVIGG